MKARVRRKFNIFEGIDGYHIDFYQNTFLDSPNGVIAIVTNRSDSRIHFPIVVDDEQMKENGCSDCVYDGDHENILESAIFMESKFLKRLLSNKPLLCALWHEIGHFHTFRYFENQHDQNGSIDKIRGEYIKRGEILPEEKAADLFALYKTSKEKMATHFDLSIEEHVDNKGKVIPKYEMTVREFKMRKEYIESIGDSKEDILKELCKVCGVEYDPPKKR